MTTIDESLFENPQFKKEFEEFTLDLIKKKSKFDSETDGNNLIEIQKTSIKNLITKIHKEVLNTYTEENLSKAPHTSSRPHRTFDNEFLRLRNEVFSLYKKVTTNSIPETLLKLLQFQGDEIFQEFLAMHFTHITEPAFNELEAPGDDIFLFILHLMTFNDEKAMNRLIADEGLGPTQSTEAVHGMCGLLSQALRAKKNDKLEEAYSYLIDTSFMLGMSRATSFMNARVDAIASRRFAKKNAQKKHTTPSKLNTAKAKVAELYTSLKPSTDPKNADSPRSWISANQAHGTIALAMHEDIQSKKIGDSTILRVCQKLFRQEKEQLLRSARPTISVSVEKKLSDGTVIRKDIIQ